MEFDTAVAELDVLVQTLEREGDERALMLLELVDAIHRPALERVVAGELEHPVVQAVLAMYEIVPLSDEEYVEEALDEVRPYVEEHGGEVELVEVEDGAVHLRFGGACGSGAESAPKLREGVERALHDRYPGFREIVAHEPDAGVGLPLAAPGPGAGAPSPAGGGPQAAPDRGGPARAPAEDGPKVLSLGGLKRPVFADVGAASDLAPGEKMTADADGTSVLVVNVAGEVYAFKNVCSTDGRSELDGARLTQDGVIVCPWHNCAFDARSGKRVDGEDAPGLAVVPIKVTGGALQVAVTAA